ncbi:BcCMK3, calcium/calmodulin-dependent protein kinase [Xylogone sp. PMI_703]|nr:BcCMK3, calcium/calmodulin-dependent protein kinase [Xylogone sp. PMI_703]
MMSLVTGSCETSSPVSGKEAEVTLLPKHGINLNVPAEGPPTPIQPQSVSPYPSPLRHHRRTPSYHREIKETLNARSAYMNNLYDGKPEHHINQYIIKDEIGRGSFGAVHLAVDQYGQEYAIKEFSKSRLRKRAQSNILRRPHFARRPGPLAPGSGFSSPSNRNPASQIHDDESKSNSLYLIKEEIAIMKKLNHPNLVSLIEVLDDPEEDSLYMVLEMCKKGVVMKVGLDERADPYDAESCRCWFRDLILGIEYLHAQGVVHRDIKPDNLLLTEDDVLKVVDFGVSEMFDKQSDMRTSKSAGSPAFLPPELCVAKHGNISGRAADIWSMGVSLYCLRFGRIPFERSGVLEMYEAIKNDDVVFDQDMEPEFVDLMRALLEKNPDNRITMEQLRNHPWVTKNDTDPLLSSEENISDLVEPPSEAEVNHAITVKMRNLLIMMKAVKKFKALLKKKTDIISVQPIRSIPIIQKAIETDGELGISVDAGDDKPTAVNLESGRDLVVPLAETSYCGKTIDPSTAPSTSTQNPSQINHSHRQDSDIDVVESSSAARSIHSRLVIPGERGHAHDPLDSDPLFLGVGLGNQGDSSTPTEEPLVAESPTAADFDIYGTAYQEEVKRIRETQGHRAKIYLTKRVDENALDTPNAV